MRDLVNNKVSVIIPAYNAENTIINLLNDLKKQTYCKNLLEIIIVNDGSKDRTSELCRNFCANNSNFILIDKENGGVSSARNKGLEIATGKFVTFFDSDDRCNKDIIKIMVSTMIKTNADLVCCGILEKNKDTVNIYGSDNDLLFNLGNSDLYVKFFNDYWLPVVWNKLYKRELIKESFVEDISYDEDTIFNLQYLKNVKNIACVKDSLYTYNINSENSLTSKGLKDIFDKSKITNPYRRELSCEIFKEDKCVWVACKKIIESIFLEAKYLFNNNIKTDKILSKITERLKDDEVQKSLSHYQELNLQDAVIKELIENRDYVGILNFAIFGFKEK